MATWNEQTTRYERPASTNRVRDFLVMAAFSLAALVAAFTFVQFKYADGQFKEAGLTASARLEPPAEPAAPDAPPTALAEEEESQTLSEMRAELERTRGSLEAAVARIDQLDTAFRELQVAQAQDPGAEPIPPATARTEPPAAPSVALAALRSRGYRDRAGAKGEAQQARKEIASSDGAEDAYVVKHGDTLAKIASDHCLPLSDLLRLNPEVRDPRALRIDQKLVVEDRCVSDPKDRAAAE